MAQLSGSKINVELYRMFIPRDEEFISWQGTMWLIVCGYVLENIRNWFVYFVCYLELVEGLTFPNWQYLGHGWVLFSSHFHSVKFHLFVRRFQCLSKILLRCSCSVFFSFQEISFYEYFCKFSKNFFLCLRKKLWHGFMCLW